MLSTLTKGIEDYSNNYRNEKALTFGKGHLRASKGQKPTWVPLFKSVFGAFLVKQIFHDFLKEGMHPNVGRIKYSDEGLTQKFVAKGQGQYVQSVIKVSMPSVL